MKTPEHLSWCSQAGYGEAGMRSWLLREEGTRLGSKLFSWLMSWERRSLKKSRRVASSTRAADAVGAWRCEVTQPSNCQSQELLCILTGFHIYMKKNFYTCLLCKCYVWWTNCKVNGNWPFMSQFPYHPERFLEWTILPDFMFETSEQWVKVLNAKTSLRSTPQTSQAQKLAQLVSILEQKNRLCADLKALHPPKKDHNSNVNSHCWLVFSTRLGFKNGGHR